ncbi:MAG: hypothetical protein LBP59_17230 [Planctomycetaceae bacterium]|nr:hypothetical protein [Planctomycetaceae bacterium]
MFFLITFNNSFAVEYDIKEKVLQCFRSMDDSRMRLNSGICHISGKIERGGEIHTEPIKIAFDYQKGMYRFDLPECYSLRTPEFYYEYWFPDKWDSAIKRQKTSEIKPSWKARPFDIQLLGFFSLVGPYWYRTYQPDYRKKLLYEDVPVSYKQLSEDLIFVETERIFKEQKSVSKRKYWLSPKQGYSMIRGEFGDIDTFELSWVEKNKTWVPVAFKLSSVQPYSADWKIDWELVNEPVSDKYFDPNLLSEKSVPLYADELGVSAPPIGQIGGSKDSKLKPVKSKSTDYDYIFRITLITVGLCIAFIAFIKMFYDRWKKTKQA